MTEQRMQTRNEQIANEIYRQIGGHRFTVMTGARHTIYNEWPEGIRPRYKAAKTNFKNGYLLIEA